MCIREARQSGRPGDEYTIRYMEAGLCRSPTWVHQGVRLERRPRTSLFKRPRNKTVQGHTGSRLDQFQTVQVGGAAAAITVSQGLWKLTQRTSAGHYSKVWNTHFSTLDRARVPLLAPSSGIPKEHSSIIFMVFGILPFQEQNI